MGSKGETMRGFKIATTIICATAIISIGCRPKQVPKAKSLSEVLREMKLDRYEDLVIETIIGEYSTIYKGTADKLENNRQHNLELAASIINSKVIQPGEEFSFNNAVGMRTIEGGFKVAPVIVRGEYTSGIGGGICQVATTLFNAAELAGLKITERHKHSILADYVPRGKCATVSWGTRDFRFINSTKHPIVIRAIPCQAEGNAKTREIHVEIATLEKVRRKVEPEHDSIMQVL